MAFHTGQTFTYGETPSAAKMQYIWDNDYALADGTGIEDDAIIARHIGDGEVVPEALVAGAGTSWVWQSHTPTFANFTLGNGSIDYKYVRIGKSIINRFKLKLGSTSVMGSTPTMSLPVTSQSAANGYDTDQYLGVARLLDAGVSGYPAHVIWRSTTTVGFYGVGVSGATYGNEFGLSSGTPFSWGNNDQIYGTFIYEAA